MEREIKFRAYQAHPSLHRAPGMYQVTGIEFYDGNGGGEAFLAKLGHEASSSEYLDDISLMQFTGLHDKNGTEIYEGDILSAPSWFGGRKFRTPDGPAKLEMICDVDNFKTKRVGRLQMFQFSLLDDPEVIGNIHENPELLA